LIEQNIPNLIKGKEYTLYFNFKEYKVIALDNNKVTLPGLIVQRQTLRDEENGGVKNGVEKTININAYFDPDSMEIRLSNKIIEYWKGSHTGSLRGRFLLHRNTYIDDYFYKMIINLPENFEFNALEGNKLCFKKYSHCNLVISVNYDQTLKLIKVGESGYAFISKISVKPIL